MGKFDRRLQKLEADLPTREEKLCKILLVAGDTPTPEQEREIAQHVADGFDVGMIHLIGVEPNPDHPKFRPGSHRA